MSIPTMTAARHFKSELENMSGDQRKQLLVQLFGKFILDV